MTYQDLWHRLTPLYDEGEAQAIVRLVLEVQFGITLPDIYTGKVNELSREAEEELEKIILRLERSEPVQYVLGRETFCGRTFHVAPGVLIPRPETEVLCRWIEEDYNRPYCALQPPMPLQVLDVGTGSGCIAVTLAARPRLAGNGLEEVDLRMEVAHLLMGDGAGLLPVALHQPGGERGARVGVDQLVLDGG